VLFLYQFTQYIKTTPSRAEEKNMAPFFNPRTPPALLEEHRKIEKRQQDAARSHDQRLRPWEVYLVLGAVATAILIHFY
jgi:hypothetical protein